MKELHERIRDLREEHNLTQKAVAAYLNVTQQSYSGYESGRCGVPTWVVTALAKLYRVSTDYLLGVDTSYFCNTNLAKVYIKDVTMYDVMYNIQKIRKSKRIELLDLIQFLIHHCS